MLKEEQLNDFHIIEQIIKISESDLLSEEKKEEMILARLYNAGLDFIKIEFIDEDDEIHPEEKPSKTNDDENTNIDAFLIPCDIMILDLMNTSVKTIVVLN